MRIKKQAGPLRILSYNIHQGQTLLKKRQTFVALKAAMQSLHLDVLLLQEVAGLAERAKHEPVHEGDLAVQLEALADAAWPYHAYGKNSLFSGGFHGNAILSRYPIRNWKNVDITVRPMQGRGALHAEIEVPFLSQPLQIFAVHLGLLQVERNRQVAKLLHYLSKQVDTDSPLLLAGDFNDWREKITRELGRKAQCQEAFYSRYGRHARTFPVRYPVLCLDRIYFRGLTLQQVGALRGKPWTKLSDHAPMLAEFGRSES